MKTRIAILVATLALMAATCVLQPAHARQRTSRHQRPAGAPTAITGLRHPAPAQQPARPIALATATPQPDSRQASSNTAARRRP